MLKRGLLVVLIALLAFPLATLQAQGGADEVLLEDDFSNPKTGWEEGEYQGGTVGYGDGFYVVTSTGSGNMMWGVAGQDFTDVVVEVDATQFSAPENDNNGYGVMCRVQPEGGGYLLYVSGDGYASIILVTEEFSALVDWTPVDAVVQGDNTNHLEATCEGSNLSLSVNGVPVVSAEDATWTSGDVALSATSFETTGTEIHFDDIRVTAPGGAAPGPVNAAGLFSDDFSDDGSGWEIGTYDAGSSGYGDGYYFVTAEQAGIMEYGAAQRNFTDTVIEVDVTQFSAPDNDNNAFGVICRLQPDGDGGYILRISGDGFASIVLYQYHDDTQQDEFTPLVDWTTTDAVIQGDSTNHLQVVCDGTHLALHVNGELAVETDDATYSSGDIALTASTYEDAPTEIHFDNVVVTAPEGAPPLGTPVPSKNVQ